MEWKYRDEFGAHVARFGGSRLYVAPRGVGAVVWYVFGSAKTSEPYACGECASESMAMEAAETAARGR